MSQKTKVKDLIIGAGISGLSYANFCGHKDYLIIEKDKQIGGYCKTIKQDGFTWDYSGHFFHFRKPEIEKYLVDRMKGERVLKLVKRTQIKYKDRYIDFPFQKNIHQLPKDEFIDCLYDLFNTSDQKFSTFKEMVFSRFGEAIAQKFLIPYNEKLYACDMDDLDHEAMGRFFPHANKEDIINNFRNPRNDSYNATFTYPRNGAIQYINALFSEVEDGSLSLNEKLIKVDTFKKRAITTKRNINYDRLISSIPFPKLLNICDLDFDHSLYSWNKVLVFNMGFNRKGKDDINHWIYFPEKKYCFYRIGYYDNILDENRMSLYIEIGFHKDEKLDVGYWKSKVLSDLKTSGILEDQQLIGYHSVLMNPAYVHVNRASNLDKEKCKSILQDKGIYSIGRYGDWKYCSIEDNIVEARNLCNLLNKVEM